MYNFTFLVFCEESYFHLCIMLALECFPSYLPFVFLFLENLCWPPYGPFQSGEDTGLHERSWLTCPSVTLGVRRGDRDMMVKPSSLSPGEPVPRRVKERDGGP